MAASIEDFGVYFTVSHHKANFLSAIALTIRTLVISYTMSVTSPQLDSRTATDEEVDMIRQKLLEFEQVAQLLFNNSGDIFTFKVNGVVYKGIVNDDVKISQKCPVGTTLLRAVCAYCTSGTYWKNDLCLLCPTGTYQEKFGMTSCNICPAGTSTAGLGAPSINECVEDPSIYYDCNMGYWSDDENGPCKHKHNEESHGKLGKIVGGTIGAVACLGLVIIAIYFRKAILSRFQHQIMPSAPPPYTFIDQHPTQTAMDKKAPTDLPLEELPRPATASSIVISATSSDT